MLGLIWAIDALLSPLGLLAAFASATFDYAFLLLALPAILLGFYARERTRRLEVAVALADAARDRQDLIAGASHELVTPLAVLVGLTHRLTSGRPVAPERRGEVDVVSGARSSPCARSCASSSTTPGSRPSATSSFAGPTAGYATSSSSRGRPSTVRPPWRTSKA